MAQTGYTPLLIYASGTASNVPLAANLTSSASGAELALNYADGKLYYKDSGGVVQILASKAGNVNVSSFSAGTTGFTPNTATTGAVTLAGTLNVVNGGTGQTTANAAFNALAPSQVGNSGKYLTTDGANTSWATNPLGTVTSVGGTGTVSGISLSGTVTTSGNLTLGGTLDLSSPPAIGGTAANTGAFTTLTTSSTVTLNGGTANGVTYLNGSKVLTSGSALTFDGTNLGIGTASPARPLDVRGNLGMQVNEDGAGTKVISIRSNFASSGPAINVTTNDPLLFLTNNTERARIDSSGNLLVGTTSTASASVTGIQVTGGDWATLFRATRNGGGLCSLMQRTASTGDFIAFNYGSSGVGTTVGAISTNGTTTSYVTSSDYRLKDNIAPMTGALAKVAALKPVTYKWKADGSDGEGFIAHELQEVVPQCVTGEKDAVDAEGNPKYQGIDTSFLVATLTAAIQELKAEFDAYKTSHP